MIHELAESMFPNDAFARDEYENTLYAKYGILKLGYRYEGDNHKCLLPKRNELKAPRCWALNPICGKNLDYELG